MNDILRYSDLVKLKTLEERYNYLKLGGKVGAETFGSDRFYNQRFYRSREWKQIRDYVIFRDNACDLGILGYELYEAPLVHHMNPLKIEDILSGNASMIDPEFLITVSKNTHNAIHYGTETLIKTVPIERSPGDTKLW